MSKTETSFIFNISCNTINIQLLGRIETRYIRAKTDDKKGDNPKIPDLE